MPPHLPILGVDAHANSCIIGTVIELQMSYRLRNKPPINYTTVQDEVGTVEASIHSITQI